MKLVDADSTIRRTNYVQLADADRSLVKFRYQTCANISVHYPTIQYVIFINLQFFINKLSGSTWRKTTSTGLTLDSKVFNAKKVRLEVDIIGLVNWKEFVTGA